MAPEKGRDLLLGASPALPLHLSLRSWYPFFLVSSHFDPPTELPLSSSLLCRASGFTVVSAAPLV